MITYIHWYDMTPNQQAVLLAMDRYEKENNVNGHAYKARKLFDFSRKCFRLDEYTFSQTLYKMAQAGAYVISQGNVGSAFYDLEGADLSYVEVALTDDGKVLVSSHYEVQCRLYR